MMNSFALYRLPDETVCTLIAQRGKPTKLPSAEELNGRSGFVLAPFAVSDDCPLLLLQPERLSTIPIESLEEGADFNFPSEASCPTPNTQHPTREDYARDFSIFHTQLQEGHFQKLVLARSKYVAGKKQSPLALFQQACQLYPHAFVAWISTPQSGDWLMATPEVLLRGKGSEWHTMALAGTMEATEGQQNPSWSIKNIQEQRYVATYIMKQLSPFSHQIQEVGPTTVQAANVVHLRSDFHFTLADHTRIGTLLQALHPTPAVCGLPKDEAWEFVVNNETSRRCYYSGFSGPFQLQDSTQLFVSLRCMQMGSDGFRLYAGGGLLTDSEEEMEWNETEAKMQAMIQLVNRNYV